MALEAMVQDRKAIQAGTSHFLGQNFARASGIQFQTREGKQEFGWTTSWGMTTRMVGTAVMAHGDDDGVILPPRIAPTHIVILPITSKEDTRAKVLETCDRLAAELRSKNFSMMLRLRLKSIGAIWAAELRIGSGSRKVYRCELRSGRVISRTIRSH